jgi:hypothetical protein
MDSTQHLHRSKAAWNPAPRCTAIARATRSALGSVSGERAPRFKLGLNGAVQQDALWPASPGWRRAVARGATPIQYHACPRCPANRRSGGWWRARGASRYRTERLNANCESAACSVSSCARLIAGLAAMQHAEATHHDTCELHGPRLNTRIEMRNERTHVCASGRTKRAGLFRERTR